MNDSRDDRPQETAPAGGEGKSGADEISPQPARADLSWLGGRPPSAQPQVAPSFVDAQESLEGEVPQAIPLDPTPSALLEPSAPRVPEPRQAATKAVRQSPPRAQPPAAQAAGVEPRRVPTEQPPAKEPEPFRRVTPQPHPRASREYNTVVQGVHAHLERGYSLIGMVGYSGSGKTHFLRALSLLLRKQGFEVADFATLRKVRAPVATELSTFYYPCTGLRGEKWVFVDAGGELYARLRDNDWDLPDESTALLHSLDRCRGLFLFIHLQPGHFRVGSLGTHRWSSEEETLIDGQAQEAQAELEFFDHFLLFMRALKAENGKIQELVRRCAAEPNLDKALRSYRSQAPKLDIPVMVLFTQADTFADSQLELAEGIFLSPRVGTVDVAAFAARHLPGLFGSLVQHTHRFKFDFVQSYEELLLSGRVLPLPEHHNSDRAPAAIIPKWEVDDELLSVGALPALEFLYRNFPSSNRLRRLLQRFELRTRFALRIDRFFHRRRWQGVVVL
jgi:energy-coupling factor transporter ATP-binding protein EcfA2